MNDHHKNERLADEYKSLDRKEQETMHIKAISQAKSEFGRVELLSQADEDPDCAFSWQSGIYGIDKTTMTHRKLDVTFPINHDADPEVKAAVNRFSELVLKHLRNELRDHITPSSPDISNNTIG